MPNATERRLVATLSWLSDFVDEDSIDARLQTLEDFAALERLIDLAPENEACRVRALIDRMLSLSQNSGKACRLTELDLRNL